MNSGDRLSAAAAPGRPPGRSKRYDRSQSLALLTDIPLGSLMAMAHAERQRRHPGGRVTFVVDTNPNYTNICTIGCRFCAFHRPADAPDAYTLSPEALADRVRRAADAGATTVLLQGGGNPAIGLEDWIAYIRAIRAACPSIHIHPFSPAEYAFMARQEGRPVTSVLQAVYDEGVDTIPGGGAEVLVDRVRRRISEKKASAGEWLAVCEAAHAIGFRTTATLMYGHIEEDADIVDHLLRLRDLQDRTGGFTSFIAWSFKPGNSPLGRSVAKAAHPARFVRIIAAARLILDNFDHVQSSWFSESERAGQLALMAGADDFGGVLVEENVLKTAGHRRTASVARVGEIIRGAGFEPVQRDSHYRLIS